jgi:hypothetical protein
MRRAPRLPRRVIRVASAAGVALGACGGPRKEPGPRISAVPVTRVPVEDAEPDDGVQIVHDKGHMDAAAVDAGLAPHRGALSSCYTQRVGQRTWLGGHVVLRWEIEADGRVARLLLAESDLGAWPVESCLLEVARAVELGKPIGGPAELTLPLDLTAPGKPERWDQAQSTEALGGQVAGLDACAKGKIAAPDDVSITLYVGRHGRTESVGFASPTTVLDAAWVACAEKAALDWRVPDPGPPRGARGPRGPTASRAPRGPSASRGHSASSGPSAPGAPTGQITKLAVRYRPL